MKTFFYIGVLIVFLGCTQQKASNLADQSNSFFSLKEVSTANASHLAGLEIIQASDDTPLAFRTYLPMNPKAVLIFYHGGGVHSGLSYNHLGVGLSQNYPIAVITPDIRGHGASGGSRGDAPSENQVWEDVKTMVSYARKKFDQMPVFLGGHSSGAGLILNYANYANKIPVSGYVFIAPYFGYRAATDWDENERKVQFTSVDVKAFIFHSMSGGTIGGHKKAVIFHFPNDLLEKNPEIVTFNTVYMSNALTPTAPGKQLSGITQFGLWIGEQDEAFNPQKVARFAETNRAENADTLIKMVENENHLSILINAHHFVGPWMLDKITL